MAPGIIEEVTETFILRIIEDVTKIDPLDSLERRLSGEEVFAVHLSRYFIKRYTPLTLKQVGKIFNVDHTCIIHSCKVVENWKFSDINFKKLYLKIEKLILDNLKRRNKFEMDLIGNKL